MENEKYPYQKEWKEYRKLRNLEFGIFFIPWIVIALPIGALQRIGIELQINFPIQFVLFAVQAISYLTARSRFHNWKCPRCGNKYFTISFWITSPIFLDKCRSCSLWKYEGSSFINY